MAKVCAHPRCPKIVTRTGASRCPDHDPGPWGGPTLEHRRARTKTAQHRATRNAVRTRDGARCYICGHHDPDGQVDAIVPDAEGGQHTPDQCAWICRPCHATKSGREGARARNA